MKKRGSSANSKKKLQMNILSDGLRELPDSLLILILSFLTIKEAAITSVLSKRWQFLWCNIPNLELWESRNENEDPHRAHRFVPLRKTRRFVAWVNRILAVRTTNELDKFSLRIQYDQSYDSDISKWIEYALRSRAIKKLILLIHSRTDKDEFYMLPGAIYSSSSLQFLMVQGHILMLTLDKVNWKSLIELYLEDVLLDQELLDDIFTGCPLLYRLDLKRCYGPFHALKVKSRNLRILAVQDLDDIKLEPLTISATYLHFLDLNFYPHIRSFHLSIDSLYKARIGYDLQGWNPGDEEMVISYTREDLLKCIQNVEDLQLNPKCFQAISMVAVSGWRLPQSSVRSLEVSSSSVYKHNISGIMAILESSPNLETLVLDGSDTNGNYAYPDYAAKGDLDCNLLRLKNIYIKNFADPNGEPMLTLARILLKRATILETMEIVIDVVENNDFITIDQELLLFPRASVKAIVVIKQK